MFICIILAIAGLFAYGLQMIRTYAIEVTRTTRDAAASSVQVEQLASLQERLVQAQALVSKSDQIYATPDSYQAIAINDIQRYATTAGIPVRTISFPQPDGQPAETRRITVALNSPLSYDRLIRFLQLVEGNAPKMQTTAISVARPERGQKDQVSVSDITINMSVR